MIKSFKSEKKKEMVLKSYNNLLKMWDTEIKEVDIETSWGTTHCIIAGDEKNPPLLMFHGVGDNSAVMWILDIKALSKHFYCIAVDTIGGPGKSVPNENYMKNNFNQINWINEVAEKMKIKKFNILGISNGAVVAYNYVTHQKEKVNKVVCLEGGMLTNNPMITMMQTLRLLFPQILIPTKKNMIAILKKLTSPDSGFFENCPKVAEHLIMVMKAHNQMAMTPHLLEKYDKDKGIAVRDKLYFLMGDYMHMLRERKFIEILDNDKYKYKIIKGAGHAINHEQPEVVDNEIIQFLLD